MSFVCFHALYQGHLETHYRSVDQGARLFKYCVDPPDIPVLGIALQRAPDMAGAFGCRNALADTSFQGLRRERQIRSAGQGHVADRVGRACLLRTRIRKAAMRPGRQAILRQIVGDVTLAIFPAAFREKQPLQIVKMQLGIGLRVDKVGSVSPGDYPGRSYDLPIVFEAANIHEHPEIPPVPGGADISSFLSARPQGDIEMDINRYALRGMSGDRISVL